MSAQLTGLYKGADDSGGGHIFLLANEPPLPSWWTVLNPLIHDLRFVSNEMSRVLMASAASD